MIDIDKKAVDAKLQAAYPLDDRWHNRFHLEMPFGLINDPNGLAWWHGTYHIFYQWNPFGCEHRNKCWAHTATRDFVHYRRPELALWPTDVHDKDGCYSGCGTVEDDRLRVLYTCNAKEDGIRIPAQRFGTWVPETGAVRKDDVIVPQEAEGYTGHFRDPYIFSRGGKRYFVLGAQTAQEKGRVLIYEDTGKGWKLLGPLHTRYDDFGYMWECPNLLRFGDYDVLAFCPQGLEAQEFAWQNQYQSGYVVGRLSLHALQLMHGEFQEFDKGFDFYAPQIMEHAGRHILLGWMGMPDKDDEYPTRAKGWQYCLTMPRVLTLRQGHIYSAPVEEMRELRVADSEREIAAADIVDYELPLSDGAEILLNLRFGQAAKIAVSLVYGQEKLVFAYDRIKQTMVIDRTDMKLGGRGKRRFKLFAEDTLNMRFFVDRTAVEGFFQYGEQAASLLVFPEKYIMPELTVHADLPLEAMDGTVWKMAACQWDACS